MKSNSEGTERENMCLFIEMPAFFSFFLTYLVYCPLLIDSKKHNQIFVPFVPLLLPTEEVPEATSS